VSVNRDPLKTGDRQMQITTNMMNAFIYISVMQS